MLKSRLYKSIHLIYLFIKNVKMQCEVLKNYKLTCHEIVVFMGISQVARIQASNRTIIRGTTLGAGKNTGHLIN
jgi:hypothetical protein